MTAQPTAMPPAEALSITSLITPTESGIASRVLEAPERARFLLLMLRIP
jgi:hypothetical protein